MLIPYELDVPFERQPWMNWLLVGSIVAVFGLQTAWWIQTTTSGKLELSPFGPYILRDFSLKAMVGHLWLHADLFHLIGNMLFLWLFGNAVCQKLGNLIFLPIYLFLGLAAALASLLLMPHMERGMVGASGAINGIVGMYVVLYPRNDISVFYWWFLVFKGTFEISGYWMILMWLGFDFLGAIQGGGNVGYIAHLGGFFAGAGLAVILLLTRRVVMDEKYEESLLDLIREKFRPKPESQDTGNGMDIESAQEASRPERRTLSGTEIAPIEMNDPQPPLRLAEDESPHPAPKFIRYKCSCGKRFKSHVALAGRVGECPECNRQIVIPDGPIR